MGIFSCLIREKVKFYKDKFLDLAIAKSLKGSTGAIKDIVHVKGSNLTFGCGYDRFLRVFDYKTNEDLPQIYLKNKLNVIFPYDVKVENESEEESENEDKEYNDEDLFEQGEDEENESEDGENLNGDNDIEENDEGDDFEDVDDDEEEENFESDSEDIEEDTKKVTLQKKVLAKRNK